MRIHLKTTANDKLVPFDYQKYLVGTLHKWLGTNTEHDLMSLYSFSWLYGSVKEKDKLNFPKGAISASKRAPFTLRFAVFYKPICHLLQNRGF